MSKKTNYLKSIDWLTIILYLILVVCGWFSVYSTSYNFEDTEFWDFGYRYGKQLTWIGLSLIIGGIILMLDSEFYNVFAYGFYAIMILVLIVTVFVAPNVKGSHSWLVLGPVSIQPAEFAKTATCLALAKLMSDYGFNLLRWRDAAKACFVLFLPVVIILLQNETGSALVYFSLSIMFYREGMPGLILLAGLCAIIFFIVAIRFGGECIIPLVPNETESLGIFIVLVLAIIIQFFLVLFFFHDTQYCRDLLIANILIFGTGIVLYKYFDVAVHFIYLAYASIGLGILYQLYRTFWAWRPKYLFVGLFMLLSTAYAQAANYAFTNILQPHQRERIQVTLGMLEDAKKSSYNVNQSVIAIGHGGMEGTGLLNGTQIHLGFVPEVDTDFIYCAVGEEHGFIGCALVLVVFLILVYRIIYLAEKQKLVFSRIYGYCVASIIFFHIAINVGMVSGLTPVIGIPLPFFSYGGSSLWGFTILLFIFLRMNIANESESAGRRI